MYTMEDFNRRYVMEHFGRLTPEEVEEVLQKLPPERRLAGLSLEQCLAGLPPEQRLAGLSVEVIQHYLDQLTAQGSAGTRKRGRKKS